jgi:phenylacetate-coenzyme A ligase PaaK-like adenylate-forming protein
VITDLSRRVQPMIRYRMNDVVTFDPRHCPCGSAFRVLSRIEGRCDDVCYFEDSAGRRRPVFPDTIRRMTLLASPHILDYQAFQEAEGQLRLHLQVGDETCFDTVRDDVRQTVETTLAQYGCRAKRLSIERGLVPVPPRTKRRRVQRLLTAAEKE